MAKTILLADDSMTIQKVVELTFMDQDYQVVAVSDGESAIQRLADVNPDLVIADVHMPGASGYEVCRTTKAQRPGTPVLLLVGTFEQFDEEAARAAGADGDLKKPFDSQELLGQVDRLIAASAPGPVAAAPAPDFGAQAAPPVDFAPPAPAPAVEFAPPAPAAPEIAAPSFDTPSFDAPSLEAPSLVAPPAAEPSFEMESAPGADFSATPITEPAPITDFSAPASPEPEPAPMAAPETVFSPALANAAEMDPPTASPETLSTQLIGTQMPADEAQAAAPEEVAEPEPIAEPEPVAEPEPEPELVAEPEPAVAEPEPVVEPVEPDPVAEPSPVAFAAPAVGVDGNAETRPMPARQAANGLTDEDVERVARRVVELLAETKIQDVAWEVVPDLAEVIIKERIKELESQVESA